MLGFIYALMLGIGFSTGLIIGFKSLWKLTWLGVLYSGSLLLVSGFSSTNPINSSSDVSWRIYFAFLAATVGAFFIVAIAIGLAIRLLFDVLVKYLKP